MLGIEKLASNKTFRALVMIVFASSIFAPGFAELYVRFHYAEVMPRSAQPGTGRIYPLPAQYGGTIYVNKTELDRRDFLIHRLEPISAMIMMLCFGVAAWSGWWLNPAKPYSKNLFR